MSKWLNILFNGDSNVAGTELESWEQGMASQLAKKLGASNMINLAAPGASNDLIYESTLNYLNHNINNSALVPQFVVIGWSQCERIQWFIEDQYGTSRFWEINQLGVGAPIPTQYQERYQYWVDHISTNGLWKHIQTIYWHNKIYNLHRFLISKQIPHLFFNAIDSFVLDEHVPKNNWGHMFYSPYDSLGTYINYCQTNGYQEITPGWRHYPAAAHEQWAEVLYQYILSQKILK